ncbi:hypothetical protein XAUC_00760 [Xanthomonas citri pv. aurantifolii str. ICPB 10535]|nr:hypothetical protein XAUC_00760 [Xanthomonas citri pv. aurantifolii str. ICPB 10535]
MTTAAVTVSNRKSVYATGMLGCNGFPFLIVEVGRKSIPILVEYSSQSTRKICAICVVSGVVFIPPGTDRTRDRTQKRRVIISIYRSVASRIRDASDHPTDVIPKRQPPSLVILDLRNSFPKLLAPWKGIANSYALATSLQNLGQTPKCIIFLNLDLLGRGVFPTNRYS